MAYNFVRLYQLTKKPKYKEQESVDKSLDDLSDDSVIKPFLILMVKRSR
jgi:hypothetical protein